MSDSTRRLDQCPVPQIMPEHYGCSHGDSDLVSRACDRYFRTKGIDRQAEADQRRQAGIRARLHERAAQHLKS